MIALWALVDQPLLVRDTITHPVLEMGVTQVSKEQLSALKSSFAQRTIFSGSLDLKLLQDGHVETVWSTHLLVDNLDAEMEKDSSL